MFSEFYGKHHLKKSGEGPGGKFNGPSVKYILKEESLKAIGIVLPDFEEALHFTNYLGSVREVHELCIANKLPENHSEIIEEFRQRFEYLHKNYCLTMKLKIHVILSHYQDYFNITGTNFK